MELSRSIFNLCALLGTLAFAISGAIIAIEKDADLFGVLFLGLTTATGGGMLRDIMLGKLPPGLFFNPLHVCSAIGAAALVFLLARIFQHGFMSHMQQIDKLKNVADALGLGANCVTGAQIVMAAGYADNLFLVVAMGMFSAVGGGMLRDLLLREIPGILRNRIYALAAIAGATAYTLLLRAGVEDTACIFLGLGTTFILRMLATIFRWDLPRALKPQHKIEE